MRELLEGAGWQLERTYESEDAGFYAALITKSDSSVEE